MPTTRWQSMIRDRAWRLAALILTLPAAARAQESGPADSTRHDANVWAVYAGSHQWSTHFGVHLEGQVRRADGLNAPKQFLLRPGVRYSWTDRVTLTAGYAYQRTSPHGLLAEPIPVPEHRAWEQVEVETPAGRVALAHRVRLEHRWQADVEEDDTGAARRSGWSYSNRARYQLRATRPLHGGAPDDAGWYLTATEEPFVRVGPGGSGRSFDQNRAFLGLGRRWGERLRAEGGYLHQYDVPERGRAREVSHVLQLTIYSEAPIGRGR